MTAAHARRNWLMIWMLVLAAGEVAWAIGGLISGSPAVAAFGFPLAVLFLGCAALVSPRGVERRYYLRVHRVLALGRGRGPSE